MIRLDGTTLTVGEIVAAAGSPMSVALSPQARDRVARSAAAAEEVGARRHLYGRTTGVGANRGVIVGPRSHARDLLRSHATSAGPLRPPERVRAMLLVRLNQLVAGGSGASSAAVDALAAMIDADALPAIREYGGIGTGDIPALATTALALSGESATTRPLPGPVALGPHDVLPLISSNAATLADAALAVHGHHQLARATLVVSALTFTAVRGNPEAFARPVELATPFDGARAVCRALRVLTAGGPAPARLQDPYGLRAMPQVHGVTLDALVHLADVVTRLVNAPGENPLVLAGADGQHEVAHHGGFHAAYLASALDAAAAAVAASGGLTTARLAMLVDPGMTGLAPFLAGGSGGSGVMIMEYVGGSALAELRHRAAPVTVQSAVLSRGMEEHASFASTAAASLLATLTPARVLLAAELVTAVRALRATGLRPAGPVADALDTCRNLPEGLVDRDLTSDLEVAAGLLGDLGDLAAGVQL